MHALQSQAAADIRNINTGCWTRPATRPILSECLYNKMNSVPNTALYILPLQMSDIA